MNIFKQILGIFAILMVQFTCNPISETEEMKLDSKDDLVLDANSTYSDNVIPEEYQTPNMRSLKSEPNNLEDSTTNDIETSELENSLTQGLNSNSSNFNMSDENMLTPEEPESLTSEDIGISTNILKHQSRSLKDFKFKEDVDGSNNRKKIFFKYLSGSKMFEEFNTKEKIHESMKNLNKYQRITLEHIFKKLDEDINDEIPVPVVPMAENFFRVLIELGINPFNLNKRVNPQIYDNITTIYNELIRLIGVDIKSNNFPLVFYQTVSPIIKEYLFPLLNEPNFKHEVNIIDKNHKFPGLFIILRDIIEIPEDLKNEYTISNFFRIIDKDLSKRKMNENEGNKYLGKLYKNGVENIQQLLDEDWKENKSPMNFLLFISDYFNSEKFLVIGRILNQILTQKLEMNEALKKSRAQYFEEL